MSPAPCATGTVVRTAHYRFAISLQPLETIYTQAQVKAKHPKSGEATLAK